MTKSMLPSPDTYEYSSLIWRESAVLAGIRFGTRRMSLAHRIELTKQVRELTLRHEFLRAGDASDQLEAVLGDLLSHRLYIEWGLAQVEGLTIDGVKATPELLIQHGPEELAEEIAKAIISDLHLSEEERKNF